MGYKGSRGLVHLRGRESKDGWICLPHVNTRRSSETTKNHTYSLRSAPIRPTRGAQVGGSRVGKLQSRDNAHGFGWWLDRRSDRADNARGRFRQQLTQLMTTTLGLSATTQGFRVAAGRGERHLYIRDSRVPARVRDACLHIWRFVPTPREGGGHIAQRGRAMTTAHGEGR